MLTEKDYCDYDTCVALKELGYDEPTEFRYDYFGILRDILGGIKAPTLHEAQKWLREEKKLHIEVLYQPATWTCKIYNLKIYEYIKGYTFFVSYEEALLEGVRESIKLLKEGK